MTRMRRSGPVLSVVVVAVLLAGCDALAPAPLPSPVEPVDPPAPYLALACVDAVSPTALDGLFGLTPTLLRDESSAVASVEDVAGRQAGVLSCTWGDVVTLSTLEVDVLPDAAEQFAADILPVIDMQYSITDTVGDRSQYRCGFGQCRFDVLVGTTWIAGTAQPPAGAGDEAIEARLAPVLADLAAAVAAMGAPGTPWQGPADALAAWPACGDEGGMTEAVRTAFEKPDLYPTGDDASPFDVAVAAREEAVSCVLWADDLGLSVRAMLVPGGSWAVGEMLAAPPVDRFYGEFGPASFGDAGDGLVACGAPGCAAFVAVSGSLVRISAEPATRDQFLVDVEEAILGVTAAGA